LLETCVGETSESKSCRTSASDCTKELSSGGIVVNSLADFLEGFAGVTKVSLGVFEGVPSGTALVLTAPATWGTFT
jgi:hypothetical protein